MKADVQLPFVECNVFSRVLTVSTKSTTMPDNKRMIVKLDASMTCFSNASRQSTEFAANAKSAKAVKVIVLNKEG